MAGHSHFANIVYRKDRVDKKRGALFGQLSRAIMVAARRGGPDPQFNIALRVAVEKARKNSMPKDNIERAVKKGSGELGGDDFVELTYEGFGPGGVAVLCDALTDNRNRTAGEVRKTFEVHGGNLGGAGAVAWMFERKGLFAIPVAAAPEDRVFEIALDAGADDVKASGDIYEVTCAVDAFADVSQALEAAGLPANVAEIARIPANTVELSIEDGRRILELVEALQENEDVQSVTANYSLPDALIAELTSGA
ncbi:MAG: YebC/PmpR family DNA-binding transcriptional regulator [Planctomyces sp.]|nr:YebC/PmpR family DNA-binding transcriptional regulator [Planctomyces sp.]